MPSRTSWQAIPLRAFASVGFALCVISAAGVARAEMSAAEAFGKMPTLWGVDLSPDGSRISYLTKHSGGATVAVVWELEGGTPHVVLASQPDGAKLYWCRWANRERLLCGYRRLQKSPFATYFASALFAINHDGSERKALVQAKVRRADYVAQAQDDIVDWLPDDPKHVLIEAPGRKGTGVSKLNIYSGSTQAREKVRDAAWEWISDGRGALRVQLLVHGADLEWRYRVAGKKKWRSLHETPITDVQDVYEPAGFASQANQLLVFKRHAGKLALWSEDLTNDRQSKLIFAHPEVDVGGTLSLGKFNRLVAVGYSTDRAHLHYFDPVVEEIASRIAALYPGQDVNIIDESWDQRYYLVYIASDIAAGAYFRFDQRESVLARISQQHPQLEGVRLASTKPIHYEARDGIVIPGYLTLPESATSEPLPGIILPHGDPESRDYWGYKWLAQFMAARGYAVLQSNYRGSGGFGEQWLGDGGLRKWRRSIADVTDAAHHLIETGMVDASRLCIVGWSYGGFAALLSAVEEPELYRCVVSIAGVTDLPKMISAYRRDGRVAMLEWIGKDRELLRQGSPARRADEFVAPVLLFHGDEDLNVLVEQSQLMAKALKKKKRRVEYIEYEDVEHSIRRSDYRIDMLTRIGRFLDQHTAPVVHSTAELTSQ